MRLASNRIYLHCLACGHETPGWRIDVKTRHRTLRDRGSLTRATAPL
jgi:hypothetical protein